MNNMWKDLDNAIKKLREYDSNDAIIIYHDDADGLSSGAIAYETLRRTGYNVNMVCIEKLMDQIIEYIHRKYSNKIIFYVDIGSPHADKISEYNDGKNLVIILDHHDPKPSKDEMVLNLNPEFYGYEGEIDASGSIMTYLFSKAVDDSNMDLSRIALIGSQELPSHNGYFVKIVYEDASRYGIDINLKDMFKILQILGSVGYYMDGPTLGIHACLNGLSKEIIDKARELEDMRKKANRRMIGILYRRGLNKGRYIQWFDSYNVYRGMGTKVIGTFCSYLSYQKRIIDQDKYIFGLMNMPNIIPGLMKLRGEWIKISGRAPNKIRKLISENKYPGIVDVMVKTAEEVGGVGDGHRYAASAVIPRDKRDEYIEIIDRFIMGRVKK